MKIITTFARESLIVSGLPEERFRQMSFAEYGTPAFLEELADAEALFVSSLFLLDRAILERARKLRLIQTMGVGYEKIDLAYTAQRRIYVCNSRGCNSEAVAEHALGLMLSGLKRTPYYQQEVYGGRFLPSAAYFAEGFHQLSSRRVGIIGFGNIAKALIRILRAFGCEICYTNRTRPDEETERAMGIRYMPLEELLQSCNVISLHIPSNKDTVGLLSAERIALLRPDALLINTGRGDLIDTPALAKALNEERIWGAAVDTITPEPPPPDHPLLNLTPKGRRRFIITPHIGGASSEAMSSSLQGFFNNVDCVESGRVPRYVVNGLDQA